ncbi:DUF4870 domain-containing protein [Nocardioides euryhalodurans]|uniref:DUF4870 domain-containing protein n=1 Tax=Nocardioides euryhalodurans TaxID=2518370 RepID=A0A4P7GIU6_9ACTN|nr:DUF4870 domain-containing protein [Nocardioides euryhalodurans]QBR91647.1 DUF4870 domain-containing protein [Nocardioides euryhalodurans]
MNDPYGPPPEVPEQPQGGPPALTQEDKTWALASHIGTLVSAYFALGFLAPLVIMLVKSESPFVRRHAVESLNFQISLLIYTVVGTVVGIIVALLTFGVGLLVIIPIVIVVAVLALVFIIVATVKAANGEDYRYPLTIRLVS